MKLHDRRAREEKQKEGLAALYRISREINHWRHDMLGELSVLYRMLKNGKYREVEAYMEKLYGYLGDYPELPQPTGNEGLDAVLINTIPKCREKHIRFYYVILGKADRIDNIALGNLMENLLSNGMEACLRMPGGRELELVVRDMGAGLEIRQENSIAESVLTHNAKFQSRKGERERHGFGMDSIYHIVEEYKGVYECWEEEKRFFQRIFLNYKDEKWLNKL